MTAGFNIRNGIFIPPGFDDIIKDDPQMRIRAVSKEEFDNTMRDMGINDSTVESHPELYLISIVMGDIPKNVVNRDDVDSIFKLPHPNVLVLRFDDCVRDMEFQMLGMQGTVWHRAMTPEQAQQVVDFTKNIVPEHGKTCLVHCAMGHSRSVAVAHYIAETVGIDPRLVYENSEQDPNKHVLSLLRSTKRNNLCKPK